MRITVTGGAGYIGSILVPELLHQGHDVFVVDNMIYGQHTLAECCKYRGFSFHKVDVRHHEALLPYLKTDIIIPLAGLVGAPICDANPLDAHLVNRKHPIDLLKGLSRDQIVIMPTTESAYGSNVEVCTEDTPVNPLSTYAKDKAAVEDILMQRENSISLRLATVFGMSPRMRLDLLVNDFAWRAWKDHALVIFEADFQRTVVHVRDVVEAFVHAIQILRPGIYNVGAFSVSKRELCEKIAQIIPFQYVECDAGKDPDQRNYIVSSKKLKETGYRFTWTLDDGLRELFKGFPMLKNTRYGNV